MDIVEVKSLIGAAVLAALFLSSMYLSTKE